jgi:3-oxoacyl-[acyl-carrier protein] reductase
MVREGIENKKVVVVTGAAQGIGKAISLKLLKQGNIVVLTDINKEQLHETEKTLSELGRECSSFALDVSKSLEVKKAVKEIIRERGRIDILVNNAGIAAFCKIEDVTDELLDRMLAVNFKGAFYFCREVAPIMKKQHYGKIINVSSITAKRGDNTTAPCYGASKGALIVLTKSLARQLGPFGINVNAVAPHAIDTPIMQLWDENKKREAGKSLPVQRIGTPEDVASAVSFLASDEASFITGHVINVDGGHFMDS